MIEQVHGEEGEREDEVGSHDGRLTAQPVDCCRDEEVGGDFDEAREDVREVHVGGADSGGGERQSTVDHQVHDPGKNQFGSVGKQLGEWYDGVS